MKKAIFKFNNRHGALLCSECRVILKEGYRFSDEEMSAMKGEGELEAQYCKECEEEEISLDLGAPNLYGDDDFATPTNNEDDIRDETNWNLDTGGEG